MANITTFSSLYTMTFTDILCVKQWKLATSSAQKSTRMRCTRMLKFDTQTTHGLWAEFRGLGFRMTHAQEVPQQNTQ